MLPIYGDCALYKMKELQTIQNKCIKAMYRLTRDTPSNLFIGWLDFQLLFLRWLEPGGLKSLWCPNFIFPKLLFFASSISLPQTIFEKIASFRALVSNRLRDGHPSDIFEWIKFLM